LKWKTKHMRNCNWMTKLKRIKTSINRKGTKQEIHRMKNEIKKQEMKRAIVYITSQERKKRGKNQTTIDNNSPPSGATHHSKKKRTRQCI